MENKRCDYPKLLPLCEQFLNSMKSYESEFKAQ